MSRMRPLDHELRIGSVVPVLADDGRQYKAEVVSAENVPTAGNPDRWQIKVRVPLGGGKFVTRRLSAPGSEPGKTVVVLIDN